MELSTVVKLVRQRSGKQVCISLDYPDQFNRITSAYRRCFYVSQFNIVKLETLLLEPLKDIRPMIPEFALPFNELPQEKLESLKRILGLYRKKDYRYKETHYRDHVWIPIFGQLFCSDFQVETEFNFRCMDRKYPNLSIDISISAIRPDKSLNSPLLLAELSRRHLQDQLISHKDEEKLAIALGASLLKLMGYFSKNGKKCLEQFRVFGILGGATDFDLCRVYPVFPSESINDFSDFYIVFSSSKTLLRYRMIQLEQFHRTSMFCDGDEERPFPAYASTGTNPQSSFPAPNSTEFEMKYTDLDESSSEDEYFDDEKSTTSVLNEAEELTVSEEEREKLKADSLSQKKKYRNIPLLHSRIESKFIAKHGSVDDKSLQVLEQVSNLVKKQADLVMNLPLNDEFDKRFQFSSKRIRLMKPGRPEGSAYVKSPDQFTKTSAATTTDFSPPSNKKRKTRADNLFPTFDVTKERLLSFLDIFEAQNLENNQENDNPYSSNISTFGKCDEIYQEEQKIKWVIRENRITANEMEIQNHPIIKSSCYFSDIVIQKIFVKYEELVDFDSIEVYFKDKETLIAKFLLDSFAAVRTLHEAGYVHGNISPDSIGFNKNKFIFQLFDFSNARSIEDAKKSFGKYYSPLKEFMSRSFRKTGVYTPLDDYIGVFKTLVNGLTRYVSLKKALKSFDIIIDIFKIVEDDGEMFSENIQDWFLFKSFRTYWRYSHNPSDPSLKAALPLLKEMIDRTKTI